MTWTVTLQAVAILGFHLFSNVAKLLLVAESDCWVWMGNILDGILSLLEIKAAAAAAVVKEIEFRRCL